MDIEDDEINTSLESDKGDLFTLPSSSDLDNYSLVGSARKGMSNNNIPCLMNLNSRDRNK